MDFTRAALYIRVSTEEQVKEGYSLEAQKANLIDYARKHNYKIAGIYADEGITARKSYKNRKAFMQLLKDVEAGKIDLILFIKLDRWFRNIGDYYKIQEILDKNHVNWKATTENYDTETANGRLYINIRLAVAQDECDRTSERIRFVFEKKISEGRVITGSIPFGYSVKEDRLVINEKEAEIVRAAYEQYLQIGSQRATYKYIMETYGYSYSLTSFCKILKNEKYYGLCRNNENYCPAIISKNLFFKVQQALGRPPVRSTNVFTSSYVYIFSGLIRCGECSHSATGLGVVKKNSKEYRYYLCRNKMNYKCGNYKRLNEKVLEDYLLENIDEILKRNLGLIKEKDFKEDLKDIHIKALKNRMARLRNLYIEGLIEIEDYRKEYEILKKELIDKEAENINDDALQRINTIEEIFNNNSGSLYFSLSNEDKRKIWRSLINYVEIFTDGSFKVFYK